MGTRGAVARLEDSGFSGRYHHWDSYPSGLGAMLFQAYNGFFQRDLEAMMKFLIDDHPAGWSTINGADFSQPAGFHEAGFRSSGPQCYCHGGRSEEANLITDSDASSCGCEWVYAFDVAKRELLVLSSYCDPAGPASGQKMIGMFGSGDENGLWLPVARVLLDGSEPDWEEIEKRDALPAGER